MADIAAELEGYFKSVLAVDIKPEIWPETGKLPAFLSSRYLFYLAGFLKTRILLMCDEEQQEQTPAVIRKHLEAVKTYWEGEAVYARLQISPFNRKRLIGQGVPFVVPYNQMYLPDFALDLREYYRSGREERDIFTPAAQAAMIYVLMETTGQAKLTPAQMALILRYSAMTMTRAFNQIETAEILPVRMEGRERCMLVDQPKRDIWKRVLPYLASPVLKRVFVETEAAVTEGYPAGISALAEYSAISAPGIQVRAVDRHTYKKMRGTGRIMEIPYEEPGCTELEVWSYNPEPISRQDRYVDPLSLFLSLRDDPDDRVEMALDRMMEALPW